MKDDNGNLPIHLAAKYEASPEIVGELLAAYPMGASERSGKGSMALHVVLESFKAPRQGVVHSLHSSVYL